MAKTKRHPDSKAYASHTPKKWRTARGTRALALADKTWGCYDMNCPTKVCRRLLRQSVRVMRRLKFPSSVIASFEQMIRDIPTGRNPPPIREIRFTTFIPDIPDMTDKREANVR